MLADRVGKLEQKMLAIMYTTDFDNYVNQGDWEKVIQLLPFIHNMTKKHLKLIFALEKNQGYNIRDPTSPLRLKLWKAVLRHVRLSGDDLAKIKLKSGITGKKIVDAHLLSLLIVKGDADIQDWIRKNTTKDESFVALSKYKHKDDDHIQWAFFSGNAATLRNLFELIYPESKKPVFPVTPNSSWSWDVVRKEIRDATKPAHQETLRFWLDVVAPRIGMSAK